MPPKLALETIPIARNCAVYAVHWQQPNYRLRGQVFWACKTSVKIQKKISQCTDSCAVSKSLNRCRVRVQKAALLGDRKNMFSRRMAERLGRFPPQNFVSAHYGPTLIFQVSSKSIQYWGKTLPQPSKVNAIHALWAYKYTTTQNEQKKLELGLVTFSNIWPGNGTGILSTK